MCLFWGAVAMALPKEAALTDSRDGESVFVCTDKLVCYSLGSRECTPALSSPCHFLVLLQGFHVASAFTGSPNRLNFSVTMKE